MRLFGLIGYPLSHSFSKTYFENKFLQEGITDAQFENYSIDDIALLKPLLTQPTLQGLAVTIPHKKAVIDFLDVASEEVKIMGACNCIVIKNGKLYGYNTDVTGFELSFAPQLLPHHKQALILGTGGAAAAVAFVLRKLNIVYQFVSRSSQHTNTLTYEQVTPSLLQQYEVIINCSPIGTYPNINDAPLLPYEALLPKHYLFDLVYNPAETLFLQYGKAKGALIKNGYSMLALQADENWRLWNG